MLLVLSFSLTCMRAAVLLLLLLLLLLPLLMSASFTIARSLGLCCLPVRRRRRRCHPCVSTRFPCVRTCRPQAVVAWSPLLYVHSLGSRRTTDPDFCANAAVLVSHFCKNDISRHVVHTSARGVLSSARAVRVSSRADPIGGICRRTLVGRRPVGGAAVSFCVLKSLLSSRARAASVLEYRVASDCSYTQYGCVAEVCIAWCDDG